MTQPPSGSTAAFGEPTDANATPAASITAAGRDRCHAQWRHQTRSEVLARHGMVAAPQPVAAQAGLQILQRGGTAADAAVATAAVLGVVDPHNTGIGGDMFAIYYDATEHRLRGINASGWAPSTWTSTYFTGLGHGEGTRMPRDGANSVTVPGAVDGWWQLQKRYGNLSFHDVLEPAILVAEQGFGITENIHCEWLSDVSKLQRDTDSAHTFLVDGDAPALYSNFRNPDLGRAYRLLQRTGRDGFYQGDIARAIVEKIKAAGGSMSLDDMFQYEAEWVDPISIDYHGYDIYEMPPNSQGFATLEMLNILDVCAPKLGLDLAQLGPRDAKFWHLLVEAKKLATDDLYLYNGDPRFAEIPVHRLISKEYAATLHSKIDPERASTPCTKAPSNPGTVYLAAADRWGNMVSFICSNNMNFGSGLTVPGYGFPLQDRGNYFSLDPTSPNIVAPRKRPLHTIIPAFIMKNGQPLVSFGNAGGDQQAQLHATKIVNMIDLGMNLQAADDAARFSHDQESNRLELESSLYDLVGPQLAAMGHDVYPADGSPMGGHQAIHFTPILGATPPSSKSIKGDPPVNGIYRAGSSARKDGHAVGW